MFLAEPQTILGGVIIGAAWAVRELAPIVLRFTRERKNGPKLGSFSPEVWKGEFTMLGKVMENQTEILKTMVEHLGEIKTNTAILVDRK